MCSRHISCMSSAYRDVLETIHDLRAFRGKMSLQPIRDLMAEQGDPHQDFPAIHIAGTNGKGSTATILAAILEEAGYTTGLFTSPHLVAFPERIRVDGEPIPEDAVASHGSAVLSHDIDISYFEAMTGIAFTHFAAEDVDVAVVETGMGGAVDATNVVEPEATVITNVSADHTRWLGETPEQIAYEKAGIAKRGVPLVTGATGEPRAVIDRVAARESAPVHPVRPLAEPVATAPQLDLRVAGTTITTALRGRYQVDNVNTALTILDVVDRDVPADAVRRALATVTVPGRMEQVDGTPFLLDGAHNPAAMDRLVEAIGERPGDTIAVVSIMDDKDWPRMLSALEQEAEVIICSRAGLDRAADPDELAAHVTDAETVVVPDIPEALDLADAIAADTDTALVTGSLYFVGDVKRVLQHPDVPAHQR